MSEHTYWLVASVLNSNVGYGHSRTKDYLYSVAVFGECAPGDRLTVPKDGPSGHPCVLRRAEPGETTMAIAHRPTSPGDELITYAESIAR